MAETNWTEWLVGQGFRPDIRSGSGKLNSYMTDLSKNYGLGEQDFTKAFQAYGAQYSPGERDENNNGGYFGNDPNVAFWNEQSTLRALGQGLDKSNPGAAYSGKWNDYWNRGAETAQQNEAAKAWEDGANNISSDTADLGDILKGVGFVMGGAGLAGAFGGGGLFGGGGIGPEFGELSSSAFGGQGAINAATGAAAASGGVTPQGGGMDWLDEILNSTQGDAVWNTSGAGNPLDFLGGSGGSSIPNIGPDFGELSAEIGQVGQGSASNTASLLQQMQRALQLGQNVPTSAIKSLFGTSDAGATSLSSLLGKLGAAGLGAYASNQQSNALADLANKYQEYGAPYRAELGRLQSDPGSFLTSPRVTTAVDQGTSAMARALSAKDGNPMGSGRALQELQNYSTNSLYGQLTNRENQLANFGGLSNFNAAAPNANLAAVNQTGNMYNAIGAGLNDVLNPQPTYLDLMKAMKGLA